MNKKKRIVITGMGVVSALGNDVDLFYEKLLLGQSSVSLIDIFDVSGFPTKIAGFIKNFDPGDYIQKKQARRVDPFIRYAMVAGKKAVEMSRLTDVDKNRVGVLVGSGMGGMHVFYDGVETLLKDGVKKLTPFFVPYIITNMAGALLAIDLGFKGPNYSISTACATSNYCIISAAEQILLGNADVMICGGSEASMNPIGLAGFVASRAISTRNDQPTKASRPWDVDRDGFVMGEGSGVLVLESLEHAINRNAPIYAEFLAGHMNCDAFHMTEPVESGEVVALCMQEAIKKANLKLEDVNYINAHATSTKMGDLCEIRAIKRVFGEHAKNIKINCTKSIIGHCLGAAGGIEAIATIEAIKKKKIHPNINLENVEPEAQDLNVFIKEAENFEIKAAISNSFGFGGHNSSIVLAPYEV